MSEVIMPAEFSDEQWASYIKMVEDHLHKRLSNAALLSTFDFIAGASIVFFVTGNNKRMPFRWILGMVDQSGLPTGLLEEANQVRQSLEEARQVLYSLESMVEKMYTMERELKVFQTMIRAEFVELQTKLDGALDLARKARVIPADDIESEEA